MAQDRNGLFIYLVIITSEAKINVLVTSIVNNVF